MAWQSSAAAGVSCDHRWVHRWVQLLFAVSVLSTIAGRSWAVAGSSTVKCGVQPAWSANISLDACSCETERVTIRPCSRQWMKAGGAGSEIVTDHGNLPWIPEDQEVISGVHCNILKFRLQAGRTIFVKAWNGSDGGRLIMEVHGDVRIKGTINGIGRGYRGGPLTRTGAGYAGESTGGGQFVQQTVATRNSERSGGGGGGGVRIKYSQASYIVGGRPGAGASYGSAGSAGVAATTGDFPSAGVVYGDACLTSLYPGSGGGGGGASTGSTVNPPGGPGGNGGASIFIYSATGLITVATEGSVRMDGNNGFGDTGAICGTCPRSCDAGIGDQCSSTSASSCFDFAGPGGGGSGGAVHLSAEQVNIKGTVSAVGGRGGVGVHSLTGCGGDAGVGRVRIDGNQVAGTTTPPFGNDDKFSYCPCNTTVPATGAACPAANAPCTARKPNRKTFCRSRHGWAAHATVIAQTVSNGFRAYTIRVNKLLYTSNETLLSTTAFTSEGATLTVHTEPAACSKECIILDVDVSKAIVLAGELSSSAPHVRLSPGMAAVAAATDELLGKVSNQLTFCGTKLAGRGQ